jgi:hypothetical protein
VSEHHPSCRESDKDLIWLCNQCGAKESAEDLEQHNAELVDKLDEANARLESLMNWLRQRNAELESAARIFVDTPTSENFESLRETIEGGSK